MGSGVSALIYQVLWLRLMGLVFGVTTYAASTVWASFMAGLALGSVVAGRFADRVRRPLMWFGACELLIGVTALATPLGVAALQQAYGRLYPSLPSSLAFVTLVRFTIAFAVLIVPTSLMGATLPLVIKSSAFRASRLGERMALLYGMNTTGAIVGALAAGVYLVPARGIHGTFLVAAILNTVVGVSAVALGSRTMAARTSPAGELAGPPARVALTDLDARRLRVILCVFAVSGFTSLALEVVWFRVLSLFLRPTVYGFALMLAAILAGIAIGSYLITPFLGRRAKWIAILAGLEFGIAVAAVLSFGSLTRMSPLTARVAPLLSRVMAEWLVYPTVGSLLTIFPTALLMGMAFPIGLRLWASGGRDHRTLAERIGIFYSLNLAGAIVGSVAAGFFLLPRLGSQSSLIALATISFGSGLWLLVASELGGSVRAIAGLAASIAFALAVAGSHDPFDQFVQQRYRGQKIVWREEGVDSTVVVLAARSGELSLTVNGNHQASTGGAQVYVHRSIGHLPMVLHPDAHDALVIGLGGGATAGAVSIHDGIEVDVVELAGSVVRGARYLDMINYSVLSRPNVHLRIDDGRNYMLMTPRKYDVVTADVIHPIYAGSGNLYSTEYFQLVRRVLEPGGMVLQWAAGTEAEYKSIVRTFLSVFPNATAWAGGDLLIGTVEPLRVNRQDFERKLMAPGSAQGIRDLGLQSFDDLRKLYRAGPDELREFVGPGPILTDDLPLVEYFLSLPRDRDPDFTKLKKGDFNSLVAPD